LNAANQQKFVAVGKGDIVIELSNGVDMSKLTYLPTFDDSRCIICNAGSEEVGNIPQSNKGIYKVMHDNEDIANSVETVTYIDFHKLSEWVTGI
jgi:hypothetical protein